MQLLEVCSLEQSYFALARRDVRPQSILSYFLDEAEDYHVIHNHRVTHLYCALCL